MPELEILQQRIADDPDDARAHYELAVLVADTRGLYGLPDEVDDQRILTRMQDLLARAIHLDPKHARAHAALGYAFNQLGAHEHALVMFELARDLDPKRESVDVFVATMLVDLDREEDALAEIEALAKRRKVNLKKLRAELAKASFPSDAAALLQGFIHARNFLGSELGDEAERIRNSLDRGRKKRVAKAELDGCTARQAELKKEFNAATVPKAIRSLAAAAARYGVGDDVCRPLLMKRIPKAERARLIKAVGRLAPKVDAWLDSFGGGDKMSVEAAAFMYLMEGVEEIR